MEIARDDVIRCYPSDRRGAARSGGYGSSGQRPVRLTRPLGQPFGPPICETASAFSDCATRNGRKNPHRERITPGRYPFRDPRPQPETSPSQSRCTQRISTLPRWEPSVQGLAGPQLVTGGRAQIWRPPPGFLRTTVQRVKRDLPRGIDVSIAVESRQARQRDQIWPGVGHQHTRTCSRQRSCSPRRPRGQIDSGTRHPALIGTVFPNDLSILSLQAMSTILACFPNLHPTRPGTRLNSPTPLSMPLQGSGACCSL